MRGNEIIWNDKFCIGVDEIDQAHQKLFSMMRKLVNLIEDSKSAEWACREGIKFFKNYVIYHFESEENYMRSIKYDGYDAHKRLHDNMKYNTIPALEQELEKSRYSLEAIQHFLGICLGWLNGHIMIEDRAITGIVSKKWVSSPGDDEISGLKNAIIHIMSDMFCMDTKIVSERYGGEDFGKRLCYEMVYLTQKGEKEQIFLVYEERLVLTTIGELINIPLDRVDQTLLYAVSQISEQLVKHIGLYFTLDTCQLIQEGMQNNETFHQMFAEEFPYYSLLFDTGIGYFAFCFQKQKHIG